MNVLRAYGDAWVLVESDLALWVKRFVPGAIDMDQLTLIARVQADLADYLRETLDDMDDFAREAVIRRSLKDLRDALTPAGLADPDAVMANARSAWGRSAARTVSVVQDADHAVERQEAMLVLDGPRWFWKAKLDGRTCAFCVLMHGTDHPFFEPMASHPNCRCVPVGEGRVQTLGATWLDRRATDTLRKMLGPTRAAWVQSGRKQLADLVDVARRRLIPLRSFSDRDLSFARTYWKERR